MERRILVVLGAAGGAIAIWLMAMLSSFSGFPLILVPFATSIVLVMGSPEAEPAQPRALIGGHLVSTLIGRMLLKFVGPAPWVAALAVRLAMIAMHLTRTFHPPAGIDPVVAVLNDMPWTYLVAPVAVGACALALFAFAWHNLGRGGSRPARRRRLPTRPD
jgi:CBS-domain-containing membrane protein